MTEINITSIAERLTPALTFLVVLVYFFKDTINEKLKGWRRTKKISELNSHDVFLVTEKVRDSVSKIEFVTNGSPDDVKTKIFRHFITTATTVIDKRIKELINDPVIDNDSGQKMKFKCIRFVNETIEEYLELVKKDLMSWGVSNEDALFVVQSYKLYRIEMLQAIMDRAESISANDDYNTNYDKISAILEVIAISLCLIPKDAKEAFNHLNGRFVKYHNVIK